MEVVANLEQGELLNLKPFDTNYDDKGRGLWSIDAYDYRGRGIAIEWVEVEGPLVDSWPPPSVGRLFGDLAGQAREESQFGPRCAGLCRSRRTIRARPPRTLLREFAARAFRRPVTAAEVERYVKLAKRELDDGQSFEEAMRVAFRAVLTSPRFLFLEEHPGRLDDWALAARLSYFLWSTPAGRRIAKARRQRRHCTSPRCCTRQVERMLASPKSQAFVENFVGQWLDLRQIDFTLPDRKLYPEFDDILKAAMVGETHAFFAEMLRDDLKLTNFIHSDFLMLNRCIAEHYKIAGVTGEEFRRVPLPAGCSSRRRADAGERAEGDRQRHGLVAGAPRRLGHAASARRTAAATAARRPGVRARHARRHDDPRATCQTSVAGGLRVVPCPHRSARLRAGELRRDRRLARALSRREGRRSRRDMFRGREIWEYGLGPPVDASGELADGRKFKNIDEFKQLLMQREDQVARNLTRNLLTYATGAGIQFADRDVVEAISARVKAQGGGLRTLVHEIVQSQTFQTK